MHVHKIKRRNDLASLKKIIYEGQFNVIIIVIVIIIIIIIIIIIKLKQHIKICVKNTAQRKAIY